MENEPNGDREQLEFSTLFATYAERVYRWALFFGLDTSSAEEITQEVFVTAMKKAKMPQEQKAVSSWLFQITRRLSANHRRSAWVKRVLGFKDAFAASAASVEVCGHVESMTMRQVLSTLPIKWVEVLILHDMDGYTRSEISTELGIPEGTVASRLRSGRAAFIGRWTEALDD